jgi:serine/threonine-protein kinase
MIAAGAAVTIAIAVSAATLFASTSTPQVIANSVAHPVESEPSPSAEPPPAVEPQAIQMPNLIGLSIAEARALLSRAGLLPGSVTAVNGSAAVDTVLAVDRPAGSWVARGTAIGVSVASGLNVIPAVAGLPWGEALAALQAAGFVGSAADPASSTATGDRVVAAVHPGSGTVARIGSTVALTLSPAAAPEPTAPEAPVEPEEPTEPTEPTSPVDPGQADPSGGGATARSA